MKTIAYITDIHLNEGFLEELGVDCHQNWETILEDVKARNIPEIIFGGDIGDVSAHDWFFKSLDKYNLKYVLGNHDTFAQAGGYLKYLNAGTDALYYSCERDGFKFIFLDSSTGQVSADQVQWLVNELATEKSIVVFIHHPVLPVNTPLDAKYPLENRNQIAEVLHAAAKPITVFCGHYHMHDMQQKINITQHVTPAASYQIVKEAEAVEKDNSQFGYRLIYFKADALETELILF